jgi:hypothetical protein
MIPALVETSTRLPVGAPLIKDRDGPELQAASGVLLLLLLLGATLQVRRLRAANRGQPSGTVGAAIAPTAPKESQ